MKIRLDKIAEVISGYPFRGRVPEVNNGKAHVVQMKDVSGDNTVDWGGLIKTDLTGRRKPDWLKSEDILFLSRGNNNFAVFLDHVPVPTVNSPLFFLIRVKADAGLIPEFLAWQLNQITAQQYFKISSEGSLHRSIKKSVLDLFNVVIPEVETQKRIVNLNRLVTQETKLYLDLIENRKQTLKTIALNVLNDSGN